MAARKKKKTSALVPIGIEDELMLPGDWESELESYVSRDVASAAGAGGWQFMSTRGGEFSFNGENIGNEVTVVIIGACRVNAYYPGKFDPDTPSGPSCFAMDTDGNESEMAPPEDLKTKEAESCDGCWANAFNTADTGKGKACKNGVRLAVLPWEEGADFSKLEGARINIAPTSLKIWSAFARKVAKGLHRPLFTIVTKITLESDTKDQFHFSFDPVSAIQDDELLRTLKLRVDRDGIENLFTPPQVEAGEVKQKPKRKKAAGKKKTTRRTRANA